MAQQFFQARAQKLSCFAPVFAQRSVLPQLVGASGQRVRHHPGRQCMASCFFLLKHLTM